MHVREVCTGSYAFYCVYVGGGGGGGGGGGARKDVLAVKKKGRGKKRVAQWLRWAVHNGRGLPVQFLRFDVLSIGGLLRCGQLHPHGGAVVPLLHDLVHLLLRGRGRPQED